MEKFYCVRVYGNGSAKDTLRDKEGMENWIKYNKEWRPGCMLFVNGEFKSGGCLKTEYEEKYTAIISKQILKELPEKLKGRMDTIGPQEDRSMLSYVDKYVGYRPEPDRAPFNFRE
jgi:hypothetical protein